MRRDIKSLTGLRGLAACYVAFYHVHAGTIQPTSVLAPLVRYGYIAVDLFFVLSGFVMALSYSHLFELLTIRRFFVFMTRRAARVYPLYLVLTLLIVWGVQIGVVTRAMEEPAFPLNVLYNLLLIQNWGLGSSLVIASWSISTELAAYILFPLLLTAVVYCGRLSALAAAAVSVGVLCMVASLHHEHTYGPLDVYFNFSVWPMLRCLSEFTLGLAAFRISTELQGRRMPACLRPQVAIPACLAAIVALLFRPGTDLALVALFVGLIVAVSLDEAPARFWLASPLLLLLGELSFAIYLLHFEFMRITAVRPNLVQALGAQGGKVATDLLYFGALMAAAWVCYAFIEKPGRRLVRHWARNLETPFAVGARSVQTGA